MNDFTAFENECSGFTPKENATVLQCAVMRHQISNALHNLDPEELTSVLLFLELVNQRRVEKAHGTD